MRIVSAICFDRNMSNSQKSVATTAESSNTSASEISTTNSDYDREYRCADRKMLFEVVDRATNAYLNSPDTMNLSMSLTIDYIDATTNSIAGMPGVEYRAPRININFDKLKHGKQDETPLASQKSVTGRTASEVSVSNVSVTSPNDRQAGGQSYPNLRIEDDIEEFARGARDDHFLYRKQLPGGWEMATQNRAVATTGHLPSAEPLAVICEAASEKVHPKSFWNRSDNREEFKIEQSKLTREQIEKWVKSSVEVSKDASCDDEKRGSRGSVSDEDAKPDGVTSRRV